MRLHLSFTQALSQSFGAKTLKAFSIKFSVVSQCNLPGDLHKLGKDNLSQSERKKITCDDQCALIVVKVILQSCRTQQKHIQNVVLLAAK